MTIISLETKKKKRETPIDPPRNPVRDSRCKKAPSPQVPTTEEEKL
jgi:hypothetical protein